MEVKIINVGGFGVFSAALSQIRRGESDSIFKASSEKTEVNPTGHNLEMYSDTSKFALGEEDKKTVARLLVDERPVINRALGLLHVDCVVTASVEWFKRSGISYCSLSHTEDGTITAAISVTYYRLSGLFWDAELENDEEWNDFFDKISAIPFYDVLVSREDSVFDVYYE